MTKKVLTAELLEVTGQRVTHTTLMSMIRSIILGSGPARAPESCIKLMPKPEGSNGETGPGMYTITGPKGRVRVHMNYHQCSPKSLAYHLLKIGFNKETVAALYRDKVDGATFRSLQITDLKGMGLTDPNEREMIMAWVNAINRNFTVILAKSSQQERRKRQQERRKRLAAEKTTQQERRKRVAAELRHFTVMRQLLPPKKRWKHDFLRGEDPGDVSPRGEPH